MRDINILVACEESQRVCEAFRKLGGKAYSYDIIECSGGHPEWHIMGDVLPLLNGFCDITTMNGAIHYIDDKWDMIIAFPPCTHLAVSGARHFKEKIADGRQQEALDFVQFLMDAPIKKICIENPISIISTKIKKPDQIIQPWMFGHGETKATCLWLKNLPKLNPTNVVVGTLPTGMTATVSEDKKTITFNVTTSLTSSNGSIPVTITIDGKTFIRNFSYSISFKGETGVNAT